jgi:hypothetical protein
MLLMGKNSGTQNRIFLNMSANGNVQIYNPANNSIALTTLSTGLQIAGNSSYMYLDFPSVGLAQWKNYYDTGTFQIVGQIATNVDKTIFTGDPAGAAELYYDGTKTFATTQYGINIGPNQSAQIYESGNDLYIYNSVEGGDLKLWVQNGGGDEVLVGVAGGQTAIYYAGAQKLYTTPDGMTLTANSTYLDFYVGAAAYIRSFSHGGTFELKGEKAAGTLVTFFKGDPDGAVELYHTGIKVFETLGGAAYPGTDGIKLLYQGLSTNYLDIYQTAFGHAYINSIETDSASAIWLQVNDSSNNVLTGIKILNTTTGLYYAGTQTLATALGGISVYDNSGDSPTIHMTGSTNVIQGLFKFNTGGDLVIYDEINDQNIITSTGGGATELYYAGDKAAATIAGGAYYGMFIGASDDILIIGDGGSTPSIRSSVVSASLYLQGTDSGSGVVTTFVGDPDGAAELYYAGVKRLSTYTHDVNNQGGIEVFGEGGTESALLMVDDDNNTAYLYNLQTSGQVVLAGNNSGDSYTDIFVGRPDGAADLYHAGDKQLETTVSGISVTNGQVKFPATQNPSSDVNTLDDYEEGTWAPTAADAVSGGNTSTEGTGAYTKIGRSVIVTCALHNIDTTGLTGGNSFFIQGLPFTTGIYKSIGACRVDSITFGDAIVVEARESEGSVRIIKMASTGSDVGVLVSEVTDDISDIWFTITYFV